MNPSRVEDCDLARRVEELQRANRSLLRVALAALGASLFVLLVQVLAAVRPDPPAIEAKEFLVRDVEGVVRARLAVREAGEPELELSDAQGRSRAELGLAADGSPALQLQGTDGRVRAGLKLLPEGRPQIALVGARDVASVLLTVTPEETATPGEGERASAGGAGRILLRDAAGEQSFEAP